MQEKSKLNFLPKFVKEILESRIFRLENRNLNEEKDLKIISTEFHKLNSKSN